MEGWGWEASDSDAGHTGPLPGTGFQAGRGRQGGVTSTKVGRAEVIARGCNQKLRVVRAEPMWCTEVALSSAGDKGDSVRYAQVPGLQE